MPMTSKAPDSMNMNEVYFAKYAAAHCRTVLQQSKQQQQQQQGSTNNNDNDDDGTVIAAAKAAGLVDKLYRFKRPRDQNQVLPRVRALLGVVQGLGAGTPGALCSILDVASQRGAFLWPLLDCLDQTIMAQQQQVDNTTVSVTSIDIDPSAVAFLSSVADGLRNNRNNNNQLRFSVAQADVTDLANAGATQRRGFAAFANDAFDCIVCSEILEHLEDPAAAAREMVRVASNVIVCTVPAQPDDNPEHVQLFYATDKPHAANRISRPIQQERQQDLSQLWLNAGAASVKIRLVPDGQISVLLAVVMV